MVLPVTCCKEGDSLLVRAAVDVLGRAPAQPGIVAFAASGASADQGWRWEVVVQGRAAVVSTDLAFTAGLQDAIPPDLPLLRGDLTTLLRISIELVSGWQYGTPIPLTHELEEQLDDSATY